MIINIKSLRAIMSLTVLTQPLGPLSTPALGPGSHFKPARVSSFPVACPAPWLGTVQRPWAGGRNFTPFILTINFMKNSHSNYNIELKMCKTVVYISYFFPH